MRTRRIWALLGASMLAGCSASASPTPAGPTPETSPGSVSSAPTLATPLAIPTTGRILFIVEHDEGNHVLYIDQSGLHDIATTDPTLAKASWAPDGTILFDSERDGGLRHIFRMGSDGQSVVQLTSGPSIQERPAISPDGSTIAYSESEGAFVKSHGLWVANADGSNPRQLTPDGKPDVDSADTSPAFSPDGAWIVFERAALFTSGQSGLVLIHPDGSGLRRLTDDALGAGYPRWSPDGKQILFSQHYDGTTFVPGPLWVVDVASGKVTALTDPTDPGISTEGDWSPDGRQIAYKYFAPAMDHNELRLVDADGTHESTFWVPPSGVGGAETPDWGR
jgi:Tol biopolymer transport system component